MKQTVQQRDTAAAKEAAGESLTASILADMEMQDLGPDAREVELLARAAAADRIEIGADGRIFYEGRFDEDDFEAAYRELENHYYAGEGAEFTRRAPP